MLKKVVGVEERNDSMDIWVCNVWLGGRESCVCHSVLVGRKALSLHQPCSENRKRPALGFTPQNLAYVRPGNRRKARATLPPAAKPRSTLSV